MNPYCRSILLLLVCTSQFGCKHNPNGDYIIYDNKPNYESINKITSLEYRDGDAEKVIKSSFIGKRFKVTFDDDYATLQGIGNTLGVLVLSKHIGQAPYKIIHYYGEKVVGPSTLKFRLLKDKTDYIILDIDTERPREVPPQPASDYSLLLQNRSPIATGRVVFWLKKL